MSVHTGLLTAAYLADDTDVGDETHKAGPIAIVVIVVLCVACFILFRSMSKHLRRVRDDFPADEPAAGEPPAAPGPVRDGTPVVHADRRPAPKSRPRATDDSASR